MIALENVPSGVLQARLARYAGAATARAALLLAPREDDYVVAAWWCADDFSAIQARLLLENLLPSQPEAIRVPRSALSLNAVLEGQNTDNIDSLLRAAGLDPSLAALPAEIAGVRNYAIVPIGPRASDGLVVLALAGAADIAELRRGARSLAEADEDDRGRQPVAELAAAFQADLVRLYRIDQPRLCTVVAAWQSGGTVLPEAGESLGIEATPLQAVVDSNDAALVETATRGDWLSTLSAAQGIRTTLFTPLAGEGEMRGILELATRRDELPLAAIHERLPGYSEELLALLDGRAPAGLRPYDLVRAFAARSAFSDEDGVDRLCLEVLRPDKESVQYVIGGPLPGEAEVAPLAGSATGDVMRGQPAVISTERVNGWFNQALLAQGFRSVLRVPLRYQNELLGVLALASRSANAFASRPAGVTTFAEQLALLVAAERSRLGLLFDGRQGELLGSLANALAGAGPGGAFEAAAPIIAAEVKADGLWLQTPGALVSWPERKVPLPSPPLGEARCRADLSQRSDDALDRELARRGYRSLVVLWEDDAALICAAKSPYVFDAETISFLRPAARLVASAQERDEALAAAGGSIDVAAVAEPALVIEAASGEVLAINDAARSLLMLERGDSFWAIASEHGALASRRTLTESETTTQTLELSVEREDRSLLLEVRAQATGEGLWRFIVRDVTVERSREHLRTALVAASAAAQTASSAAELRETVIRVLSQHDIRAEFGPGVDAGSSTQRGERQTVVPVEDQALTIEGQAEVEPGELEAFRTSLLSALERLRNEERLRLANQELAEAVRARTAELEGLYAYSRDLGDAESDEEAVGIAVTHAAAALGTATVVVVCLENRHVAAGPAGLQAAAEDLLRELRPQGHVDCRPILRPAGVEANGRTAARALVPTGRGSGVMLAELPGDAPSEQQLKLLLAHATQLGATLDRLGVRREAEESRLRSIADVVDEGIALVDREGQIEPENAAAMRLLEVLRQPQGPYDSELQALISEAREVERPIERELQASGRTILAAARSIPESAGRVALTLRDVTEQRLTQQRLSQSERLAALGQLVSGVAHELNNPLTGILGYAQLLQDQPLDDDARRGVETIQAEAERAGKIIQDLLSFARRRAPVREPVDINELVSRVLNIRSYDLQGDGIEVELALGGDLPPVEGDGDQLQQVFFNVLTNALQAVREVEGPRRIAVTTSLEDEQVVVRFEDNGPGIAAEALDHVFEPFFTTKEAGEGTGLGLSISYGIVHEHGGSIELRNAAGGGAVAEVRLPVLRGDAAEAAAAPTDETASGAVRILVVDDEASIREVLSQMLQGEGHQVTVAASGAEALAHLSRQDFDLVITDLKMPEISGRELYHEIRASDEELARRVIFITGDTVNEETRAFMAWVENPTLEKPFRLERLRDLIRQALA